jgi:hypothetical protein
MNSILTEIDFVWHSLSFKRLSEMSTCKVWFFCGVQFKWTVTHCWLSIWKIKVHKEFGSDNLSYQPMKEGENIAS